MGTVKEKKHLQANKAVLQRTQTRKSEAWGAKQQNEKISYEKETENIRHNKTIQEKDEEIRYLKGDLKQKDKELTDVKELLQILLKERTTIE